MEVIFSKESQRDKNSHQTEAADFGNINISNVHDRNCNSPSTEQDH